LVEQKLYETQKVIILLCEVPTFVCVKAPVMKQAWWIAASNSKIPAGILIRVL